MSNNRYLEIDSNYRNRNLYPDPADFVVPLSQSGDRNQYQNPMDPVSKASPILSWNTSFREDTASTTITITGITTANSTSAINTFVIVAGAGQLRATEDYYVGAILSIEIATVVVRRRITSYQLINSTNAEITVDSAIPNGAVTASGSIQNPTGATNTDTVPKLFIPASEAIDNFYANYYVQLINSTGTGQSLLITYYDGNTHLATLASNTTVTWLDTNLNFVIRRQLPTNTGVITAINSLASIGTVTTATLARGTALQLASTASSVTDQYINSYLRIIEPVPTGGGGFSVNVAPYGQERRIAQYIAGDGTFTAVSAGTNTFTLDYVNSSSQDNYYVGALITNSTTGDIRQITSYTGSTHSGTVAVNWTAGASGNVWTMRTAILASPYTTAPTVGGNDAYEVEYFSRDNAIPLNYIGTLGQEEICYEVELINLILPNSVLTSGRGGRPVFYPYMYVQLDPVSGPNPHSKGIIESNNPFAKKMLFRAVLDDTTQPIISPFIKIDSDGMVHVIKFKPNDAFHFAVYCPDGNLFKTVASDTSSPTEPNPLVQISACFAFKKTTG